jgi:tetratricopeptide (TPR) repeat protein
MLDAAQANLDAARAQAPESPIVAEFDGFLCHLRGRPAEAAAHYRRARSLPDCSADQRDTLTFNEARMLAAAGRHEAALAVFASAALSPALLPQACIEQAELLHRLGRAAEAATRLDQAMTSLDAAVRAEPKVSGRDLAADAAMAWLQAGVLWDRMGHRDAAASCLERAVPTVPIADYHHARLKLAGGDVDSCLRLLSRAARAVPAEVRRLDHKDAAVWQTLASDARFTALTGTGPATPGR